ncbi:alpha-1,2-fucosyltransferase [Providencia rettgeri]|uniref:alpha-1,2-fucosyltransferase n=1 Tax=Providencia TaxID=586 RepID=UPI001F04A4DE|nr:alpha-1,2-fucosyltransferase [Providencia rettgeri]EMA4783423.1 alpha-1,2-fucosyltransferase [Providencia rettgeri]MCG9952032.1 alpha-1,2-fucosyltransferase [Providencia rettgeri]MDU7495536.1 alpha-1,2-fucosyltransferase [Providencia rettgeri]
MRKKETIFLIGGFGNNLFQLNRAFELKENGYDVIINTRLLRKSFISKILKWSIHPSKMTEDICTQFRIEKKISLMGYIVLFFIFTLKQLKIFDFQDCNKPSRLFGFAIGYWQKNVVLNKNLITLLKDKFHNESTYENIKNKVILHARLGDFPPEIRIKDDYYLTAIQTLNIKEIILVTDTPDYLKKLKKNLPSDFEITLSAGISMLDDFLLMANATNLIISNSTFSYWASQVNPVKNLIYPCTIAPETPWNYPLLNKLQQKIRSH